MEQRSWELHLELRTGRESDPIDHVLTGRSCASSTVFAVPGGISRSRLLRSAGGALLALLGGEGIARAAGGGAGASLSLTARNIGRRYFGDRALLATVSPGVPGRDTAAIRFSLNRRSTVTLEAVRTAKRATSIAWKTTASLAPGTHELTWTPDPATPVGSYVMRLTLARPGGSVTVLGRARPTEPRRQKAAVVRVLGIEAAFLRRSYLPGEPMELRVMADAPALTLQFLHIGWEDPNLSSDRNDELVGALKGDPVPMDWTGKRSSPATICVQTGTWPSGLYAARLTADDGRVGFAPFVLRSAAPGAVRQLVVLPTNTWQAYNMYDRDGDGWGDTWYAGGNPPVDLTRPYRDRGVPPRFRAYDRAFLRWLGRTGRTPDMISEDDLEVVASGDDLRALYDLVVFSGHSEYMTGHSYDVIERFRDLGGRLIFLSADTFFWRVERSATRCARSSRARGGPSRGADRRPVPRQRRRQPARAPTPWSPPRRRRGCSTRPGSRRAPPSARPSAATGSRSTRRRRTPPRDGRARPAHRPLRAGSQRGDDLLRDRPPARGSSPPARSTSAARPLWPVTRMLENLWQHMLQDLPPPPPVPAAAPGRLTLTRARHRPAGRRRRRARAVSPAGRRSLTRSQWIAELLTPPRSV